MKKIIFILALLMVGASASSQTLNPFPTTDSLRRFINKWIRNSAVDAFTNLRLNTSLLGMTRFIDSASGTGGVSSFTAVNDSTARIITNEGDTMTALIRGRNIYIADGYIPGNRNVYFLNTGQLRLNDVGNYLMFGTQHGHASNSTRAQVYHIGATGYTQELYLGDVGDEGLILRTSKSGGKNISIVLDTINGMRVQGMASDYNAATDSALYYDPATFKLKYGPKAVSSSGAVWGSITGTLSSQTDLQTALNTKATNAQVSDTANTIRNAKKWPAEERIGTIYDKQRWNNLQDFTPNPSGGTMSLALSSGFVNYTVTSIDWNNFTRLLYTRPTILPNWTIEVVFKMNTTPAAGTVGFGLGSKKYISQNADIMCYINTTNSGSSGALNIARGDGGVTYATGTSGTISVNDVIRLRVTFVDSSITFSSLNLTTGTSGSITYTNTLISTTPPISAISNWAILGHSSVSCTWQVQSIKITSETKRNANLVVVGDSKTQGAFANAFANRYGTKLGTDYPSSIVYASGGATAADFLNLREELTYLNGVQYLIHLGSNSIRGGATVVNTIKDLKELYTWLKGGGATVKVTIAPEDSTGGASGAGVGLTALKNAMVAEFGSDYIDLWTGMATSNVLNSGYNSGDGVHLNQAANDFIRSTVVSSGAFTTRPTNMIAPYRVTDNVVKTFGDSIYLFPIEKRLGYIPTWTINGGLTTGILQDNGTTSGASATPLTAITGSVFNVTGMSSINGPAGALVFANQGSSLTTGRYSLLASSNEFVVFDPVAGQNRLTLNSSGFVGIGTPSQDRKLDILDATNPQIRLTNVDGSVYTDFQTLSTGNLRISPSNSKTQLIGDFGIDVVPLYDLHIENSTATGTLINTTTLGASSGGILRLYAKDLPTASGQRLGYLAFGSAGGAANDYVGAAISAVSRAAHTGGSNHYSSLSFLATASGNATETTGGTMVGGGRWFFGGSTISSAAFVQIAAGTSSVAPLQFTSGTDVSSPAAGMFYYNGTRIGFSPSTTIKRIALTDDVTPSNGQIPIGNGTDYTAAPITGGNGVTVTNGAGSITLSTDIADLFEVSTYSPTLVNVANVTTSLPEALNYEYNKMTSTLTIWGRINADPTVTATLTEIGIPLPGSISSTFSTVGAAAGTAATSAVAGQSAIINADTSNNRIRMIWTSVDVTAQDMYFSVKIKITPP